MSVSSVLSETVRVVLADDSADARVLLRRRLTDDGCLVVGEAVDGQEVVDLVLGGRPDLVVLDVAMPVLDGLQATTAIRASSPETRIIVMSAYSSARMSEQALAAGADAYVEKASDAGALLEQVHRLVPGRGERGAATTVEQADHRAGGALDRTGRDVTARASEARRLPASEEEFRAAVSSMLDGFAILSAVRDGQGRIVDFRYTDINEEGAALNRRPVADHLGRSLLELLPADDAAGLIDTYARVVETGEPILLDSLAYEDAHGSQRLERAFELRAARLGDGIAVAWRDITDRRRNEQAQEALNEQLRHANENLERFAGVASHDLRSPALLVSGLVETFLLRTNATLDARDRELLERATEQARSMVGLIDDVLLWSRSEHPTGTTPRCDLSAAAASTLEVLGPLVDESGARVTVGPLPVVGLDPVPAQHLLRNLIENACTYTREGVPAVVDVTARRTALGWEVTVADQGMGVQDADRERIFAPFERAAPDRVRGTGLGLSICRRMVERVGGRIRVEANRPYGSRFIATLPAAPEEPVDSAEAPRRPPPHRHPG